MSCAGKNKRRKMWYNPGIPVDSEPDEYLKKWASDYKIPIENLVLLNQEERDSACEALRSLAVWYSTPIEKDDDNPYWMEDEGYKESDDDMKFLNNLASDLLS
jgi:hypothetical protein